MVAFLSVRRKVVSGLVAVLASGVLAACDVSLGNGPLINTQRSVPVALLVPASSSTSAELALSLENAARMAVGDLQGAAIDLRVYDTEGTPEGATIAASDALSEGARIIVGPLFGEAARAAGQVAAPRGVNVLSFSNNPGVAGGNVFVMGNTFQTAADRLVRYSVSQGKNRFFIVHEETAADELARVSIERALAANGGVLAGAMSYPKSQTGVIEAVPNIAREFRASGATVLIATANASDRGTLPFLSELLPENGIDPEVAQFVGIQRLDVPASALSLKGLQGAWFAAPDPDLSARFDARYQAAFGRTPSPVTGLAYDAVAAVGALIAQGNSNALSRESLIQGQGFAGVYGPFRFFQNGTNERGLAVAQIQNNQVTVIDTAPRSFAGPGF